MNIKSNKNKKILPITTVAALIVLFAFTAMCTPIQGFTPGNTPPVADAGPDQTALVGDTVSFDGSGSYDPDPDGTIVLYAWDFGDGTTGTGVATMHVYSTAGTYTVTLTVTDDDDATGKDTASVIVTAPNHPPDVSKAYPSIECLWPPNHKFEFVDITIEGVTDPDGDAVTITITGITSDEPTATIVGAGGDTHAPDADGVGTAIASVRAERSGTGNGRVYEIRFVARDGNGGETEGSVTVCVPHDRRKGTCDCIDDGQNYDATQING